MKKSDIRLNMTTLQGIGARSGQQDAFGVENINNRQVLAIVADGMGGLVNSEQVSQALVKAMKNAFAPALDQQHLQQLMFLLKQGIQAVDQVTADNNYSSGSTLVCCIADDTGLSWLSIGDSRICLWRKGGLIQLNRDHDFARDMAIMSLHGACTMDEIATNPRREALTSYIGAEFPKYIDFNSSPVQLQKGDKIILMSDGIYRIVKEKQLAACLRHKSRTCTRKIEKLIQKANHPQQDNYTAVIISAE